MNEKKNVKRRKSFILLFNCLPGLSARECKEKKLVAVERRKNKKREKEKAKFEFFFPLLLSPLLRFQDGNKRKPHGRDNAPSPNSNARPA